MWDGGVKQAERDEPLGAVMRAVAVAQSERRFVGAQEPSLLWIDVVAAFALAALVAMHLGCVVMFDCGRELVQQLDQLHSRLVGEHRERERQDDGSAFD